VVVESVTPSSSQTRRRVARPSVTCTTTESAGCPTSVSEL
jgi:hypothetical protein